jgi:hypothetical protein
MLALLAGPSISPSQLGCPCREGFDQDGSTGSVVVFSNLVFIVQFFEGGWVMETEPHNGLAARVTALERLLEIGYANWMAQMAPAHSEEFLSAMCLIQP